MQAFFVIFQKKIISLQKHKEISSTVFELTVLIRRTSWLRLWYV